MGRSRMCGLWAVSCKSAAGWGGVQAPCLGWGQLLCGQPDEEVSLCCAFVALQWLPRGRGRGATGWILPSLTLEQVLPVAILGTVWGLCKQALLGAGVLMLHSAPVQSRLDRAVNLINNGKSPWLPRCLLGERSLFRHIQPLTRRCLQASCSIFHPGGHAGGSSGSSAWPLPASSLSFLKAPCLLL